MKATEELKEEHKAIKLTLSILSNVSQKLESGKKVDQEDLDSILDFIKTFADKCHHGKEEDLLFVAMENVGIPRDRGPIGVMLKEHEMGRSYVRNMSEAVDKYKAGELSYSSQFVENAKRYIELGGRRPGSITRTCSRQRSGLTKARSWRALTPRMTA